MSITPATVLRQRAQGLRLLAHRLETTPAMQLDAYAGVDTWRGPRPDECRLLLHAAQQRMHVAADDLRSRAWAFERRADELEHAGLLLGGPS